MIYYYRKTLLIPKNSFNFFVPFIFSRYHHFCYFIYNCMSNLKFMRYISFLLTETERNSMFVNARPGPLSNILHLHNQLKKDGKIYRDLYNGQTVRASKSAVLIGIGL